MLMLSILLSPLALATAMGPYPVLDAVGRDCQRPAAVGDALTVTYQAQSQSCAPGGPCSIIGDDPLDASALWVEVRGCEAPLKGRFVPTRHACEGRPLWRFDGALPGGHEIRVSSAAISMGWLPVAGDAPLVCPPEQPPRVVSRDVTEEDAPLQALTFPAADLVVEQIAEGWSISWNPLTHFPVAPPNGGEVMVAVVAERPDLAALPPGPYPLQLRYTTTVTDVAHYHRRRCVTAWSATATIQIGDLVLESTSQGSSESPRPCTG